MENHSDKGIRSVLKYYLSPGILNVVSGNCLRVRQSKARDGVTGVNEKVHGAHASQSGALDMLAIALGTYCCEIAKWLPTACLAGSAIHSRSVTRSAMSVNSCSNRILRYSAIVVARSISATLNLRAFSRAAYAHVNYN